MKPLAYIESKYTSSTNEYDAYKYARWRNIPDVMRTKVQF